jgi:hypothetical protein
MFKTTNFLLFRVFLIGLSLYLASCNKPNSNPETLDPIFSELEKDKKEVDGAIAAEEKQLHEFTNALKEVKPQTGQIKYAQKRVSESQEKLTKLKQRQLYYELHIKTRLAEVRRSYLKAFRKKEAWPDPKEYEIYQIQKKLDSASKNWSVKDRIERAQSQKEKRGNHGEPTQTEQH